MRQNKQGRRSTSFRNPANPTAELPHLIWDLCDLLFKSLGDRFEQGPEEYFQYLRPRIEAALGRQAATMGEALGEDQRDLGSKELASTIRQKVKQVQEALASAEIDLVVVHFRSRRERSDTPRAWQRVLGGSLVQDLKLDSNYLFGRWNLTRHAFEKARENGTLLFRFDSRTSKRFGTATKECVIGPDEWELMIKVLEHLQKKKGRSEILPAVIREVIAVERRNENLASHLKQYCKQHLQEELFVHFDKDEEAIAFVIESCIVTLTLLTDRKLQAPRSALLAPVFVGSERVGGVSFFSKNHRKLLEASRDLKIFARNLLTYLAVQESHELELDKRVLEQISPVTHLFVHTFNKAFTTPILNISDELDRFSAHFGRTRRNHTSELALERLDAIATFLRSFGRRWGGTFPALQSLVGSNVHGGNIRRPKFLKVTYTQLLEGELKDQLNAVFAVSMANDIFDDRLFRTYQHVLSSLDGLERLVDLSVDIPHRVPGHRDIWCLHLLNLMQNGVEALPLHDVLRRMCDQPQYLSAEFQLVVSSKAGHSSEGKGIVIEIRDNGSGFSERVLAGQKKILKEFAQADTMPPTLWEMQKRIQSSLSDYSSKSGGSYGSGLVGVADYLSRICRVRWRHDTQTADDVGESLVAGEIVERGAVEIVNPKNQHGAVVRLKVPVDDDSTGEDVARRRTGVFFEMR